MRDEQLILDTEFLAPHRNKEDRSNLRMSRLGFERGLRFATMCLLASVVYSAPNVIAFPVDSISAAWGDALPLVRHALLVIWVVIGPWPRKWRVMLTTIVLALLARHGLQQIVHESLEISSEPTTWIWILAPPLNIYVDGILWSQIVFVHGLLLAVVLGGMRFFGWSLSVSDVHGREQCQFSLRTAISFVTTVAFVLGLVQFVRGFSVTNADNPSGLVPVWIAAGAIGVTLATSMALVTVTVVGVHSWQRWVVLLTVVPLLAAAVAFACRHMEDWLQIELLVLTYTAMVMTALFVLRLCGYRLVRLGSNTRVGWRRSTGAA